MQKKNKTIEPEETAKLQRRYTQIPVKDRAGAFGSFESFSAWAYKAGFRQGKSMMRYDPDGPATPENCYFVASPKHGRTRRRREPV